MYSRRELASRFGVSVGTIAKYRQLGILSPPIPPCGRNAAYYPVPHVQEMESVWGHNGLKDMNRTLKEWAEHLHPVVDE